MIVDMYARDLDVKNLSNFKMHIIIWILIRMNSMANLFLRSNEGNTIGFVPYTKILILHNIFRNFPKSKTYRFFPCLLNKIMNRMRYYYNFNDRIRFKFHD